MEKNTPCRVLRYLLVMISILMPAAFPALASDADRVIGLWATPENDRIEIYREQNHYFGRPLPFPGQPQRLDVNNPDPQLRGRPLAEIMILKDFKYSGGEWSGGTVYDPKNGKTYRCILRLQGERELLIHGYVGLPLFGRSEIWKRLNTDGID
jgi:uncharacterized protein (DUF2147 family)